MGPDIKGNFGKIKSSLLFFALVQIILMASFSFTTSYIVRQSVGPIDNTIEIKKDISRTLKGGLNFLVSFFSIKQIGIVSAADPGCCERRADSEGGGYCLDVDDINKCDSGVNPDTDDNYRAINTNCTHTEWCDHGYCFDPESGTCSANSPKGLCTGDGGIWSEEYDAQKCDEGCCQVPGNYYYGTRVECAMHAENSNYDIGANGLPFTMGVEYQECIFRSSFDEGACVFMTNYGGIDCKRETEAECHSREVIDGFAPKFHSGKLCSYYDETGCDPQEYVGCDDNGETMEIFWYDSCDNKENIYEGGSAEAKARSYNNGLFLKKDDACELTADNKDTCGNCGENFETFCKEVGYREGVVDLGKDDEEYICGSTSCEDDDFYELYGRNPQDGESWCVYDNVINEGKDVPGSVHWFRSCNKGKVDSNPCPGGDYRSNICAQKKGSDENFVMAECRPNLGFLCFGLDNRLDCEDSPDCYWKVVDVDEGFKFETCLPRFPKGFDIGSEDSRKNGQDICEIADAECTAVWTKLRFNPFAHWHCEKNCECDGSTDSKFYIQMNEVCMSLGDCGSSINMVGEYGSNGNSDLKSQFNSYDAEDNYAPGNNGYGEASPPYFGNGEEGTWSYEYERQNTDFESSHTTQFYFDPVTFVESYAVAVGASYGVAYLLGALAAGVAGLALLILALLFSRKVEERTIHFNCNAWQPPRGADDCQKCNEDPLKQCTKYRCDSLGTKCEIAQDAYNSDNYFCEEDMGDDGAAPNISAKDVGTGLTFTEEEDKMTIKKGASGCVDQFSEVSFSIETDEPAICIWDDSPHANYEDFEENGAQSFDLPNRNGYSETHPLTISLPQEEDQTIFIKCKDKYQNFNPTTYEVDICVTPRIMTVPPTITEFDPPSESYVQYSQNSITFTAFLNRPAECRYSLSEGVPYENMTNYMSDMQVESIQSDYGSTAYSVPLSEADTTTIYIKCNDSMNNFMENDVKYVVKRTENPLVISSIDPPNGTIRENPITEEDPLLYTVTTSGGVSNDGVATCSFKQVVNNIPMVSYFKNTNSRTHTQEWTSPFVGPFAIEIFCEDEIGNNATNITRMTIDLDLEEPVIVRAFREGSRLKVITNEDARCYFSEENCDFEMDDDHVMTSGFGTSHTTTWHSDSQYFIKCKDEYENAMLTCPMVFQTPATP